MEMDKKQEKKETAKQVSVFHRKYLLIHFLEILRSTCCCFFIHLTWGTFTHLNISKSRFLRSGKRSRTVSLKTRSGKRNRLKENRNSSRSQRKKRERWTAHLLSLNGKKDKFEIYGTLILVFLFHLVMLKPLGSYVLIKM